MQFFRKHNMEVFLLAQFYEVHANFRKWSAPSGPNYEGMPPHISHVKLKCMPITVRPRINYLPDLRIFIHWIYLYVICPMMFFKALCLTVLIYCINTELICRFENKTYFLFLTDNSSGLFFPCIELGKSQRNYERCCSRNHWLTSRLVACNMYVQCGIRGCQTNNGMHLETVCLVALQK